MTDRTAVITPRFPVDDLMVQSPPVVRPRSGVPTMLMGVLGLAAMAGTAVAVWMSGWSAGRTSTSTMLPATALISGMGMLYHLGLGRDSARLDDQRQNYFDHLDTLSGRAALAAARQLESVSWVHPPPQALWTFIGGPRMWERLPSDPNFAQVRIGVADQRPGRRISVPPLPTAQDLDPVATDALRRFVQSHSTISDVPVAVALSQPPGLSVIGEPELARGLVRAVICQLAVLHGPEHLLIALDPDSRCDDAWEWLKWLPHTASPGKQTAHGSHPHSDRHVLPILDGCGGSGAPDRAVIVIGQAINQEGAIQLRIDGDRLTIRINGADDIVGKADYLSLPEAKACARLLAPHWRGAVAADGLQLWRADLALDGPEPVIPEFLWSRRSERNRLRVPIGLTADGALLSLDIKEAAEQGIGPHGLCVGATGSGKSELLRTIVLGMAARHSPDDVNLILIDFKGGATFLGLEGLHHVAAIITNLSKEQYLVARMREALAGEIHRRQQLLRRAGNSTNVAAYEARRQSDPELPVLPALFVVVDEFAELLQHHPDFIEIFTAIGRVGRSLGIHLLLASQRFDEGRLRGLDSHLSYRICLKTTTANESRAVLGVPDGVDLPTTPGAAILRSPDGRLARFQTVFLGAEDGRVAMHTDVAAVHRFTRVSAGAAGIRSSVGATRTVMDGLIGEFREIGSRAHRVWLPAMDRSPGLGQLISAASSDLTAAIGLIDRPFAQRWDPLIVDLSGAAGNVAVVGAPRTGKSTALRTLVTALACRLGSGRIQFYCLDFGGGSLSALRSLPHVGSAAGRQDPELVRRIVSHVESIMRSREARSLGQSDDHRELRGDVFLVIDGWSAFREAFGELEATVNAIAAQGLSAGVHVVIAAGRWADVRPGLKDQIGTKIELRLSDPIDSDVNRREAALVPREPGHGITDGGEHFVLAIPDSSCVVLDQGQAPPVRLLPDVMHIDDLRRSADDLDAIYIGIGERDMAPVELDFSRQAHLLVLGDNECGKTSALRAICRQATTTGSGSSARLFAVDYRRTLLGVVGAEHLAGYAFSPPSLAELLSELSKLLNDRLPSPHVTGEELRQRTWWTGPELFVVADDYDLISASAGDGLVPLLRFLPYAKDVGLHLVIARRCSGAARAMFEPVLGQLRDSGCMTLLMNGGADEGAIVENWRPARQPVGRGLLVTRDDAQLVQVGWSPP